MTLKMSEPESGIVRAEELILKEYKPESLEQLYQYYLSMPSDMREHLHTLRTLASECDHITELGTRTGVSATALLSGEPKHLHCYDVAWHLQVEHLRLLAGDTDFRFFHADVLCTEIEETDLLLIDTFHSYVQLKNELRLHGNKARKYIVLHDTETCKYADQVMVANEPHPTVNGIRGLWPAIEEFISQGDFRVKDHYTNCCGLTVLERINPLSPNRPNYKPRPKGAYVYLGLPYYGSFSGHCADALDDAIDPHYSVNRYEKHFVTSSMCCNNFNNLWAQVLDGVDAGVGYTHFAMIHSDVHPYGYWLDVMLKELEDNEADLLSISLPIKNESGLSSTALYNKRNKTLRRLTMKELSKIPDITFDGPTAAKYVRPNDNPEDYLMCASTGLWVCRITEPWADKVWFEQRDRIVKRNGKRVAEMMGEDWQFSLMLHQFNLKILASRCVVCGHIGEIEYGNDGKWGLETDTGDESFREWYKCPDVTK